MLFCSGGSHHARPAFQGPLIPQSRIALCPVGLWLYLRLGPGIPEPPGWLLASREGPAAPEGAVEVGEPSPLSTADMG